MSKYKAEDGKNYAKAIQMYDDCDIEASVEISSGFVTVEVDGETVMKEHITNLED